MTHTRLTDHEKQVYRRELRELVARLTNRVGDLEAESLRPAPGAARAGTEEPGHEADRAVREAEDGVARTLLASEEGILTDAAAALERLTAGTFGVCEECGHVIAKARLDVVPYARTCVRCARGADAPSP